MASAGCTRRRIFNLGNCAFEADTGQDSGIQDPHFEIVHFEFMTSDRSCFADWANVVVKWKLEIQNKGTPQKLSPWMFLAGGGKPAAPNLSWLRRGARAVASTAAAWLAGRAKFTGEGDEAPLPPLAKMIGVADCTTRDKSRVSASPPAAT